MNEPNHSGPRDVILQLLAIIFLYVCVISLGSLLFQYINIAYPDMLDNDYGQYARTALRWPLAVLTIVFPCYIFLMWKLQREIKTNPELLELKSRKWLLYLTIFLTALVIVGDLVALVYQFLNGGLSVRFILKILAVFAIAGSVFLYYGWNLRQTESATSHPFMSLFTWVMILLTSASIVTGFFFVGSPFAERQRHFDQRRVNDLYSIQWHIIDYWQSKERLPLNLFALRDEISGYIPPIDPESGEPYEYQKKSTLSFQLCAIFTTSQNGDDSQGTRSVPVDPYGDANQVWSHEIGRTCFDRTIDPDLYSSKAKIPIPVR
ncbi:MAG: DUF5671 domain-containing protein [Kiritimatiellales bacterium]|nr:DUF5671 domain-containing protein [Kiritimatiellales bacterium]